MKKIAVIDKDGECNRFEPKKIYNALVNETGVDKEYAKRVTQRVARKVRNLRKEGINEISTNQVRSLVNASLLKDNELGDEKKHERLGLSRYEIQNMIEEPDVTENANLRYAPASIEKHISDASLLQYTLSKLPSHLAKLHIDGDIYIHDASYFFLRSLNCIQMDLRPFIKNGFVAGGDAISNIVSKPPRHMDTLVNMMGEACLSAQQQLSGGISLAALNTFMAPFAKGLNDKELKQSVQMYLFNLASAYQSRGQQPIFQSVNLDMAVPNALSDLDAIGPDGKTVGVYGDYFDEARKITQMFVQVMKEKDALGRPFLFPNTIFHARPEFLNNHDFDEDFMNVHELAAEDGTPYFVPYEKGRKMRTVMGCLDYDMPVQIYDGDKIRFMEIGKIADKSFHIDTVKQFGESYYTEPDDIFVPSADPGMVSSEKKRVTKIIQNPAQDLYEITTDKGVKIRATADHPFYIPVFNNKPNDLYCYAIKVKGEDLKGGDKLLTTYPNYETIVSIKKIKNTQPVYDLEVKGHHTFFVGDILVGNCRTALDDSFDGTIDSAMRCGNIHYGTLNLPRLGWTSNGDDDVLFEGIKELMDKIREVLMIRRSCAINYLDKGLYKFLSQDVGDGSYYRIENGSISYAFVGLNEMLLSHCGAGIVDKDADKFGMKTIGFMNKIAKEYQEEDGIRSGVFAAPAESAAGRLAEKDIKKFGNDIPYNGPRTAPFYTNSSHVPVDADIDLIEKIKIESKYHPLLPSGQILNLFMGESSLDPVALDKLTRNICNNTDTRYFCYSPQYTFCMKCQKQFFGLHDTCPNCGADASHLVERARISGYYATINRHELQKGRGSGFNKNKVSEVLMRKQF